MDSIGGSVTEVAKEDTHKRLLFTPLSPPFILTLVYPRCGPNWSSLLSSPSPVQRLKPVFTLLERARAQRRDNAAFQRDCRPHGRARKSAWGPADTPSPNFTATRHRALHTHTLAYRADVHTHGQHRALCLRVGERIGSVLLFFCLPFLTYSL